MARNIKFAQLAKVEAEVQRMTAEEAELRQLCLADGIIDAAEQMALDRIKDKIANLQSTAQEIRATLEKNKAHFESRAKELANLRDRLTQLKDDGHPQAEKLQQGLALIRKCLADERWADASVALVVCLKRLAAIDGAQPAPVAQASEDEEEVISDLPTIIRRARKHQLNFACMLGKETVVLNAHKRKAVGLLAKQAKQEAQSKRGAWGQMQVEARFLVLTCEETPPALLARALKLHLRNNGVKLGVRLVTPEGEVLGEEEQDTGLSALQQAFEDLDPEAKDAINRKTDAAFYKATGFPSGAKLERSDPRYAELAPTWMQIRDDQVAIAASLAKVDDRIFNILAFSRDDPEMTPELALTLASLSAKLSSLPTRELAAFWDGNELRKEDLADFAKATDRLMQERFEKQEMGAGPKTFVPGKATGTVVAKMKGVDIKAENREARDFGSRDAAVAFARSLKKGAAILEEDGRYVVYHADLKSNFIWGADLELDDIDIDFTKSDVDDTWVSSNASNLAAIITDDDYVVDTRRGIKTFAELDRVGSPLGPYDAHMQAFGPGLSLIKDKESFEAQFELVMRDATYDAIAKAETAAKEAVAKYRDPMTAEDKAVAVAVLDKISVINKELEAKESELLLARAVLYTGYVDLLMEFGNPALIPTALLDSLITKGELIDTKKSEADRVEALKKEVAALNAKRIAAAGPFPLALRIEDPEAFKNQGGAANAAELRKICTTIQEDIKTTRQNVDDGDFNFWTMPEIAGTAMSSTGLQGDQLKWAQERMRAEGIEDMVWSGAEAVVTIGLAIGAIFASGGTALVLGGAALVLGGASAVNITEEYFRKGSAANIALDPTQGLLDPKDVPHWGWVVASWVGVGLDVASTAAAIKATRQAVDILKGAQDLSEGSEAVLKAAKLMNTTPEVILASLKGRQASSFKVAMMGEAAFDASFGRTASEAATVIQKTADGGYSATVVVRAGADPVVRQMAVAEEMRHIAQLNDAKFADDVALLTEEALANWQTKSVIDKLRSARAQIRLETDSQAKALDQLRKQLGDGGDETLLRKLQYQIDDAEGALAQYSKQLDEVEDALKTGDVPAGLDLSSPPRLFNTPNFELLRAELNLRENAALKKAIDDYFQQSGNLKREYYYLTKKGDDWGLHVSKKGSVADEAVPTLKIEVTEDGIKVVEKSRPNTKQMRAQIEKQFGAKSDVEGFETALDFLQSPYQRAYTRKYEEALVALKTLEGGEPRSVDTIIRKVIQDNGGDASKITDATFESAFRREMRSQIAKAVSEIEGPAHAQALQDALKAMPDNPSKGALFTDIRRTTLRKAKELADSGEDVVDLSIVDRTPGDLKFTIDGKTYMGDGIVATSQDLALAGGKGPKKAGANYLVEDKSSYAAFEIDQFKRYVQMLQGGKGFATTNQKVMSGVTYFFPDIETARKVIRLLGKKRVKIPDDIHIGGYLPDGSIAWL